MLQCSEVQGRADVKMATAVTSAGNKAAVDLPKGWEHLSLCPVESPRSCYVATQAYNDIIAGTGPSSLRLVDRASEEGQDLVRDSASVPAH